MGTDDDIIRNGELKPWFDKWIRFYDVILVGTEDVPVLKVRAWILLLIPVAIAFCLGLLVG